MKQRIMNSAQFWRIAFLVQALIVALGIVAFRQGWFHPEGPPGFMDQPCRSDGLPITGNQQDDWGGVCGFRPENARIRATGVRPTAVFMGDSITNEWQFSDTRLFNDDLVNRGIGGQASAQMLLRFHQDVVSLRPASVHILAGINDAMGKSGPMTLDMYQANMRAMVDIAEANGITVILGTIPPMGQFPWRNRLEPGPWLPAMNSWIASFAKQRGLILADYHAALVAPDGGPKPSNNRDAVHLNAAGYAAIYPVMQQSLAQAESKREAAKKVR